MNDSNIVPLKAGMGATSMSGNSHLEKRAAGQASATATGSVNGGSMARRMSAPLVQLQERARRELFRALQTMFDRADDALFELAEKAPGNSEQNLYFESMREVRLKRREIEDNFSLGLQCAFTNLFAAMSVDQASAGLELMENDVVEQMVAIDSMIAKAEKQHAPALSLLLARIAHLVEVDIEPGKNPLGPRAICETFSHCCRVLSIDIKARLVLYKLFDMHVVSAFDRLYATCNSTLVASKVLPELQWQAPQGASAALGLGETQRIEQRGTLQSHTFSGVDLCEKLQQFSDSTMGVPAFAELTDALNGLPVVADVSALSAATAKQPALFDSLNSLHREYALREGATDITGAIAHGSILSPKQFVNDLVQVLKSAADGNQAGINRRQSEAIGLVAMLFQFVLEDGNLAEAMKALISQLQVPVVKVAILDTGFFEQGSHPARRLLNEMATAALAWDMDTESGENWTEDSLYQKIATSVSQVVGQYDDNPNVFSEVLADFLSYMAVQNRRAALLEKRIVDAETGREKSENARQHVNHLIQTRLASVKVPEFVAMLVSNAWSNVLFLRLLKFGIDSAEWRDAVDAMDNLLWTVADVRCMSDRQAIMQKIPGVLKTVREGLAEISFDSMATDKFFADLERLHMDIMLRSPVAYFDEQESAVTSNVSDGRLTAGAESVLDRDVATGDSGPGDEVELNPAAGNLVSLIAEEGPADSAALQAQSLVAEELGVGQWVEIHDDESKARCRLVAVLRNSGKRIFANRSGAKVGEFTVKEIALQLHHGKMVLLDDARLFDKALASVIGGGN